jgi:hypothetical protein
MEKKITQIKMSMIDAQYLTDFKNFDNFKKNLRLLNQSIWPLSQIDNRILSDKKISEFYHFT